MKGQIWKQINRKEDPNVYLNKDTNLKRTLRVRDFLALGVGTIVSTGIFTLPGIVAAEHAGPAVTISFMIAAVVAGLSAMAYAEMASAMPFAGSAYSWISVVFGEFWGWIAGWALLAEYFIASAFGSSGLSSNLQGLLSSVGITLPKPIASAFGTNGGVVNIIAIIALLMVYTLVSSGNDNTTKIEKALVSLKVLAIIAFIIIGAFAIKATNYVPFIPPRETHPDGTGFGGWTGITAGVSMLFISYIGFDVLASNSAEAKNPKKTMPRGIIGSLIIATVLFVLVSFVLVGMFKYSDYANNSEPVGWALRTAGHPISAAVIQIIAVVGMFTALIGNSLAGSRLMYSFGRDGMLSRKLGKVNKSGNPNNALRVVIIFGIIIGSVLPFHFISELVSAGTLIAFMFVSLGVYRLRKREGKDVKDPGFKMPGYPVLPAISFLATLFVFWNLSLDAKIYAGIWFILGIIVYFAYGIRHNEREAKAKNNDKNFSGELDED